MHQRGINKIIFLIKYYCWIDKMYNNNNDKVIDVGVLKKEPGATAVLKQFKDHTDPSYVGPGSWNIIHQVAWRARTPEAQQWFIEFMKELCYHFPCVVCRGHCSEYIKNHPIEDYLEVTIEIEKQKVPLGLFIWTWKFHNAVNTRLRKPVMSWDTAYTLYSELENSNNLVCSKTCLESGPIDVTEINNKEINNNNNKNNLRIHRIINKR
jgi:hypothetical protein